MSKVTLFPTCLARLLYPDAIGAARRVLQWVGLDVEEAKDAVCCGQPAWNSGHVEEARRVARGAVRELAGEDPVVLCSGSCTTMVVHYWSELFEGTELEEKARAVATRTQEFSTFLVEHADVDSFEVLELPEETTVAYHDSCHMLRALGIRTAPRELLRRIGGLELKELTAQNRCCGFGGTFSVRFPELSTAMADEKVDDLVDKEVSGVIASDLGCLMQICGRAHARGVRLDGRYIAEVLDEAIEQSRA